MLSIDKTKDISNLVIDGATEEYSIARIIGFLQVYESEWGRSPNDKVAASTRSAEKLSYFSG